METALDKKLRERQSELGYQNHRNGYNFELKNKHLEQRLAILAITSAGSQSPIDIVPIRKDYVLLISCKANGYLDPKERRDLDKLKSQLPKFCRIQVRYKVGHKLYKQWY